MDDLIISACSLTQVKGIDGLLVVVKGSVLSRRQTDLVHSS